MNLVSLGGHAVYVWAAIAAVVVMALAEVVGLAVRECDCARRLEAEENR